MVNEQDYKAHLFFPLGMVLSQLLMAVIFVFRCQFPRNVAFFTIVTKFGYDEFCTLPQGSKNACQHVAQVVGEYGFMRSGS